MDKGQIQKAKRKTEEYEKKALELSLRPKPIKQVFIKPKKKDVFRKRKKLSLPKPPKVYGSYKEYLQSPEWKRLRKKILKRAKNTCELCKMKRAYQVHHKTYKRVFHERLTDLIAVCGICHLDKHGLLKDDQLENAVNKLIQKEGYV